MMHKNLPNVLSIIRIIASITLFWQKPFSEVFYAVYVLCGISDILDGYIARKTKTSSRLGAALDSAADFLLVLILLVIMIPLIQLPTWAIWWSSTIIVIRIISLSIAAVKFKTFAFLHTYANKLTGGLLFLFIFSLPFSYWTHFLLSVCLVATFSAVEEFLLMIKMKDLNRDVKSFYSI